MTCYPSTLSPGLNMLLDVSRTRVDGDRFSLSLVLTHFAGQANFVVPDVAEVWQLEELEWSVVDGVVAQVQMQPGGGATLLWTAGCPHGILQGDGSARLAEGDPLGREVRPPPFIQVEDPTLAKPQSRPKPPEGVWLPYKPIFRGVGGFSGEAKLRWAAGGFPLESGTPVGSEVLRLTFKGVVLGRVTE